jgi:acyl-CoA dehydrogenase
MVSKFFANQFPPATLARAEDGEWLAAEWSQLESLGLTQSLIPRSSGDPDIEPADALFLVRIAGAYAVPLPLAETMMASWLLAHTGFEVPAGPLAVADGSSVKLEKRHNGWRIDGTAPRVPWGGTAEAIALSAEAAGRPFTALLHRGQWEAVRGKNLADEPRDDLIFRVEAVSDAVKESPPCAGPRQMRLLGAAMRCQAIAGALETVLSLSVAHANERLQFGRPIGKFQAIQHNLAILAAQSAAASAAADLATDAVGRGMETLPIAVAKVRTGEAASLSAAIAHQVHGAMGFSREHRLHYFTKRLWSWREEFGNETEWSALAGHEAFAAGSAGLWPMISAV